MSQEEDEYWGTKLVEARRTQLDTVRRAATAWAGVFAGIIGLAGTITFVGGLNGLNDLGDGSRTIAQVGVAVALALMLVASVLSALAANSFPKATNDLTSDTFQASSKSQAQHALRQLRASMVIASMAAVVVLAGSTFVLFSHKAQPGSEPVSVVVIVSGKTYCGELERRAGGLFVDGVALASVTSLDVVPSCP